MATTETQKEIYYKTYREATDVVLKGKETLKTLWKEGEKEATRVRYATTGTLQEKLAAIKAAWIPFLEEIERVKKEIEENYKIADDNFDAWKGLKQL